MNPKFFLAAKLHNFFQLDIIIIPLCYSGFLSQSLHPGISCDEFIHFIFVWFLVPYLRHRFSPVYRFSRSIDHFLPCYSQTFSFFNEFTESYIAITLLNYVLISNWIIVNGFQTTRSMQTHFTRLCKYFCCNVYVS